MGLQRKVATTQQARCERGCALPGTVQTSCAVLALPSAQAYATGEKLKCAQPQPEEADPPQVRNPS